MKPEKPKNLGFKQIYFNLDKILFLFFLTFMMIELDVYKRQQPDLLKNRVKDQKANQYQSFNEALIDLKNDRIDALLIDRVYANYYLQSEGILNDYNVFSAGFESESFAVGVRPADKRLLTVLNQAFIELYKEGKFQEISQKWFGEDVATKEVKSGD